MKKEERQAREILPGPAFRILPSWSAYFDFALKFMTLSFLIVISWPALPPSSHSSDSCQATMRTLAPTGTPLISYVPNAGDSSFSNCFAFRSAPTLLTAA